MGKDFRKKESISVPVNDEIKYDEARVIYRKSKEADSEEDFNRIMKVSEALKIAESKGLDLIEINASTKPPILKIYEYSKYIWELKQAEKKKKKSTTETKEVQLSANISLHDMETKAKHALEFLEKGCRVRIVLTMRGRELGRVEESSKSFYTFVELLGESFVYDAKPNREGNKIIAVIRKKK